MKLYHLHESDEELRRSQRNLRAEPNSQEAIFRNLTTALRSGTMPDDITISALGQNPDAVEYIQNLFYSKFKPIFREAIETAITHEWDLSDDINQPRVTGVKPIQFQATPHWFDRSDEGCRIGMLPRYGVVLVVWPGQLFIPIDPKSPAYAKLSGRNGHELSDILGHIIPGWTFRHPHVVNIIAYGNAPDRGLWTRTGTPQNMAALIATDGLKLAAFNRDLTQDDLYTYMCACLTHGRILDINP